MGRVDADRGMGRKSSRARVCLPSGELEPVSTAVIGFLTPSGRYSSLKATYMRRSAQPWSYPYAGFSRGTLPSPLSPWLLLRPRHLLKPEAADHALDQLVRGD